MTNVITWSYSALRAFNTCPYRYKRVRIDRAYRESSSPALDRGKETHERIAGAINAILREAPLPDDAAVRMAESLVRKLVRLAPKDVRLEWQMGVRTDWSPCDFFASDVWGRAVADAVFFYDDEVAIIDWKTGKTRQDFNQLLLTAAFVDAHAPGYSRFHIGYFYVDDGEFVSKVVSHDDVMSLRSDIPGLAELEEAFSKNLWPPRQSRQCRYCPVLDCRLKPR